METRLVLALLALLQCNLFCVVSGACETEDDLDFETCDLKHLKEEALTEICNRIGLDMVAHVIPFINEEDEEGDETADGVKGDAATKKYTHEDYVRGAEECLLIEEEMAELEDADPDYLDQLEREALAEEPELVAEIVTDVLKQDEVLLKEIASSLEKDAPEAVKDVEGMLEDGQKLESRPDVVGFIVAKLLGEEENFGLLDKFDEALSEHFFEDEYDEDEEIGIGGGEEL